MLMIIHVIDKLKAIRIDELIKQKLIKSFLSDN